MTSEGFACITLHWLYENIDQRTRDAESTAHIKFLAARKIQAFYRGWKTRKNVSKLNEAATHIQRWYRGHVDRKRYYNLLEYTLEQQIIACYNYKATIIQKWWRGYITRLKVHDHNKMKQLQMQAAKDLILCIAYKLHYLLRTYTIPGVYSLRNSKCLSKVEQLLASLKFKEYNDVIRRIRAEKFKKMEEAIHQSKISKHKTKIPYGSKCPQFYKETKIEKMISMLDKYDPEHKKRRAVHVKPSQHMGLQPKSTPRDGIVNCMKRWDIVQDDQDLTISPHIVRQPEKIEHFLGELETICQRQQFIQPSACTV